MVALFTVLSFISLGAGTVRADRKASRIGPTGPTGVTGAMGPSGSNGAPGAMGATGSSGANGTNGSNGPTGPIGNPGSDGTNGTVGATGATGATGPSGIAGTNGSDGATGATGPTGASPFSLNESSAYYNDGSVGIGTASPTTLLDVTGADDAGPQDLLRLSKLDFGSTIFTESYTDSGNWGLTLHGSSGPNNAFKFNVVAARLGIGTDAPVASLDVNGDIAIAGNVVIDANGNWVGKPTGLVGPTGPTGDQGATGTVGPSGPTGAQGVQGIIGPQGPQGPQGQFGSAGATGAQGATGATGAVGTAPTVVSAVFFNGIPITLFTGHGYVLEATDAAHVQFRNTGGTQYIGVGITSPVNCAGDVNGGSSAPSNTHRGSFNAGETLGGTLCSQGSPMDVSVAVVNDPHMDLFRIMRYSNNQILCQKLF